MRTNDKMRISLTESRKMHFWEFNISKFSRGAWPWIPLGAWAFGILLIQLPAYFITDALLLEKPWLPCYELILAQNFCTYCLNFEQNPS